MGDPELRFFTVGQVREWLLHGTCFDGLSDEIIARQRAWAIVNNPYVKDNDAILSVIVIDGTVAAYTACFPEILANEQNRIWWLTTLWCKPEYEGQGFGLIVVGQLLELHETETVLDMDGAAETVEICRMLGMEVLHSIFYRFRNKVFSTSLKGKLASKLNHLTGKVDKSRVSFLKSTSNSAYSIRYISFIDDKTYSFISEHSNDTLPRSQDMMNWILKYPFMQPSPIINRTVKDLEFTSNISFYEYRMVQVWQNNKMCGVYGLRICPWGAAVKCIYYADTESELFVNQSIAEHVLLYNPKYFETCNKCLATQVSNWRLFDMCDLIEKSYNFPDGWNCTNVDCLQAWDGDMFV